MMARPVFGSARNKIGRLRTDGNGGDMHLAGEEEEEEKGARIGRGSRCNQTAIDEKVSK